MKVLNVSSSIGVGGREMLVMTLSEGLRNKNCDVRILTAKNTWIDINTKAANFKVYNLPMKKYIDVYSIYKIGKILQEFKPDVVHIYFISDMWLVIPAVKLFYPKTKIFLLRSMQSWTMKDWARTQLFKAMQKVIVMSDFLKDDFLAKTRVEPQKVETIYIGVDIPQFDLVSESENVLKRDYKLGKDDVIVGLVGRIDRAKGQDKFINAARIVIDDLRKNNPDLAQKTKFFIVGSSEKGAGIEYENNLKNIVKMWGIADNFVFTGFRKDIPSVMNSLDIAVFPSMSESFGLVVIEAMAARRAVVGFNTGAFPEIISNYDNGIIVPYDHKDLARGILELVLNPEMREKFAKRGRQVVEEKFSLDMTLEKFLELYRG